MSDIEPPSTPPPIPPEPPRSSAKTKVIAGFLTGAILWALSLMPIGSDAQIILLLGACLAMPVVGTVLAIFRITRQFGLGLLLSTGIGWLLLLAMCGGWIK